MKCTIWLFSAALAATGQMQVCAYYPNVFVCHVWNKLASVLYKCGHTVITLKVLENQ